MFQNLPKKGRHAEGLAGACYRAFRISVLDPKNAGTSEKPKRVQFSTISCFEDLYITQYHNKFQLLYMKLLVIICFTYCARF